MGQSPSTCKDYTTDTVDGINFQFKKHSKILNEINDLTFENFQKSLQELNDLSRKCLDLDGNQIIFTVKKDSDKITFLWKALIKIACVKVNPTTRKILSIKMISLKDFIHLSNTMSTNLEAIRNSEEKQRSNSNSPSSVSSFVCPYPELFNFDSASTSTDEEVEECCICLDRKTEVILSCLHSFCSPCIETWNESNPTCPLCMETMLNTEDSWVPIEHPEADEINEEIINQLTKFSEKK